jgi:uncharacterized membrane protein YeaQ/YmgE (transglycosylase-associated protein family)
MLPRGSAGRDVSVHNRQQSECQVLLSFSSIRHQDSPINSGTKSVDVDSLGRYRAAAGLLASRILGGPPPPVGTIGDALLGMVGGYIVALLGASGNGGILGSFVAALAGALLLIWLSNLIKK